MLQLAYLSVSTERAPDVEDLARQAAPRNASEEITGFLMHINGNYLQVLEGPREVVEDAFLRIILDDRHKDLEILARRMITGRQFGSSSMVALMTPSDQASAIDRVLTLLDDGAEQHRRSFEEKFCLQIG